MIKDIHLIKKDIEKGFRISKADMEYISDVKANEIEWKPAIIGYIIESAGRFVLGARSIIIKNILSMIMAIILVAFTINSAPSLISALINGSMNVLSTIMSLMILAIFTIILVFVNIVFVALSTLLLRIITLPWAKGSFIKTIEYGIKTIGAIGLVNGPLTALSAFVPRIDTATTFMRWYNLFAYLDKFAAINKIRMRDIIIAGIGTFMVTIITLMIGIGAYLLFF